jgi:hypothetical protein
MAVFANEIHIYFEIYVLLSILVLDLLVIVSAPKIVMKGMPIRSVLSETRVSTKTESLDRVRGIREK